MRSYKYVSFIPGSCSLVHDASRQVSTPGCPFVLYRMHVLLGDEDWRVRQVALEALDSLIDR